LRGDTKIVIKGWGFGGGEPAVKMTGRRKSSAIAARNWGGKKRGEGDGGENEIRLHLR